MSSHVNLTQRLGLHQKGAKNGNADMKIKKAGNQHPPLRNVKKLFLVVYFESVIRANSDYGR
jgi:hypothetical protein